MTEPERNRCVGSRGGGWERERFLVCSAVVSRNGAKPATAALDPCMSTSPLTTPPESGQLSLPTRVSPSFSAVHTPSTLPKMLDRLALLLRLLIAFYTALASARAAQEPLVQEGYKVGQPIPVSCLNRTM